MGWVKGSVIAAGVLSATVALAAWAGVNPAARLRQGFGGPPKPAAQVDAGFHGEKAAAGQVRERVVVPQIEVLQGDRAQLGVSLRDVDEASAKEHKLPAVEGALVEGVEAGGAAEKAGVNAGDVISSFDGERVRSVRQLQRLVADTPPGRAVKVGVVRDGRKMELTATLSKASGGVFLEGGNEMQLDALKRRLEELGNLPRAFRYEWRDDQAPGDLGPRLELPAPPRAQRFPFNGWTSGAWRLGVVVQELTPQLAEYFGAKEGVLVASVTEGSPAEHAGIKAGDVITTADGKTVGDANALVGVVRAHPDGQDLTLVIVRDHKPQTIKVKLLGTTRARPI